MLVIVSTFLDIILFPSDVRRVAVCLEEETEAWPHVTHMKPGSWGLRSVCVVLDPVEDFASLGSCPWSEDEDHSEDAPKSRALILGTV